MSNQPVDIERFIAPELSDILTADTSETAKQRIEAKKQKMLTQNQTLVETSKPSDLRNKRDVAKAYWKTFVSSRAQKDHIPLRRYLTGFYPDPLYIQNEFDTAVKELDFNRFLALFEPLPVDFVININANENLGVQIEKSATEDFETS